MSEWKITKLGDIITHKKGVAFKSLHFKNHGHSIVRVSNLTDNSIDTKECLFLGENFINQYNSVYLKTDDIVIATVGSWESNPQSVVGKVIRVPKKANGYLLNQNAVRLRAKDPCQQSFLYYALKNKEFFFHIIKRAQGSANQASITLNDIFDFYFLMPYDSRELSLVTDILLNLDRKIENLRRQNETLEKIAQALFKHWFVDFEFPNAEGQPYKSSGGEMVPSELGNIPAGWRVGKLGDEVETLGGGTPSTKDPDYWINGDIPWYSPTDLTKSNTLFSLSSEKQITKLGLEKSSAKLFPAYSLLLTSRATIGAITINTRPACTNQGFITIVPNEKFSVYFLHGWLLTQINLINQLASGSTFPELSKSTFRDFLFLIPDTKQIQKYDQIIKPIFQKVETNIRQIQTLTKTRDTLLPKLMSGQLRIKP